MGGFTSAAGSLVGTAGGMIGAGAAREATKQAAAGIRTAANQAGQLAQFRPVGMTTAFGTSQYGYDDQGKLNEASYTMDPELKAIQDRILAQAGTYDTSQLGQAAQPLYGGASQLFGLGQQYLSTSPEEARAEYMRTQQAALAPAQERTLAGIQNKLFQTGRGGLATGGTAAGGMSASNPEMQAYYNSLAQQNLQLATQAESAAQQRQAYGAGLFGSAGTLLGQISPLTTAGYAPLQTQLGLANTMETMAQQPITMGSALGAQAAQSGAQAGQFQLQGELAAAPLSQAANSYSAWGTGLQGLGSAIQSFGNGAMAGQSNVPNGSYAGRGISGTDSTGYTYANQAGPTQSGGNLYNVGSSGGGSTGGISSWFSGLFGSQ
jgi:YD repeat-containing protein